MIRTTFAALHYYTRGLELVVLYLGWRLVWLMEGYGQVYRERYFVSRSDLY